MYACWLRFYCGDSENVPQNAFIWICPWATGSLSMLLEYNLLLYYSVVCQRYVLDDVLFHLNWRHPYGLASVSQFNHLGIWYFRMVQTVSTLHDRWIVTGFLLPCLNYVKATVERLTKRSNEKAKPMKTYLKCNRLTIKQLFMLCIYCK